MGAKEQMIAILRSGEAARINFSFAGGSTGGLDLGSTFRINGGVFRRIAAEIVRGKLHVVEDEFPMENKMIYVAWDDPAEAYEANTFYLGNTDRQSRDFGGLVVHESVHAWFDLEKLRLPWIDNEAIAYIAQAYYLRNSGFSAARIASQSTLDYATQAIANMRKNVDASGLIDKIRNSLRSNPNYHTNKDSNFIGNG